MLAMAWLQPVVERYEREGLKQDAEQLHLLSAKKGERISDDLKQYSVKAELKQKDMEDLVHDLLGSGDLRKKSRQHRPLLHPESGYREEAI